MSEIFLIREVINFCSKLNDAGIFNFFSVVIWSCTFIFTIRQLQNQKKEFYENKIISESQHRENKEINENNHKEMLEEQIKYNRISVMPYLILDKKIDIRLTYGEGLLGLCFQNKGNGTAIEIRVCFKDDNSGKGEFCMASTDNAVYDYAIPFNMELDLTRNSETCYMSMYRKPFKQVSNSYTFDTVYFKVIFKDMYLNEYEQKFMYQFKIINEINNYEVIRVESFTPELLVL